MTSLCMPLWLYASSSRWYVVYYTDPQKRVGLVNKSLDTTVTFTG